jgi:hypothetical protein
VLTNQCVSSTYFHPREVIKCYHSIARIIYCKDSLAIQFDKNCRWYQTDFSVSTSVRHVNAC